MPIDQISTEKKKKTIITPKSSSYRIVLTLKTQLAIKPHIKNKIKNMNDIVTVTNTNKIILSYSSNKPLSREKLLLTY